MLSPEIVKRMNEFIHKFPLWNEAHLQPKFNCDVRKEDNNCLKIKFN